jgi:RNA polymerase sigma-70 factor (ECF subfamily)
MTSTAAVLIVLLATHGGDDLDDPALARRIKNGDRAAFEIFFRRHHAALFRYLTRRGCPDDVAEDIIQNAFVYIWRQRGTINPNKSLRGYLFTIGYSRMLNHSRDTAKFDYDAELDGQPGASAPDATAEHQLLQEHLHAAIDALPERRRAVFELCFMEDLTYREAADVLGITRKTVENHMRLALKDVRAALAAFEQP